MAMSFEVPTGLRFGCRMCGDCCRTWNVMLGPGEAERLQALDWTDREPELVDVETVVRTHHPGSRRPVERLHRRESGACVYLGDDDRCLLHRHFGGDAKPLMCRLYPFAFSRVGDRWAVDCSFSCSSVSRFEGAPLEANEGDWEELLAAAVAARERDHRLDRRHRLGGELLRELQSHLLSFLADDALDLFDRVRCCLQFVRLATTGDPTSTAAATLRAAIAKGLPRQIRSIPAEGGMDRSQSAFFYQWLYLTINPVPPNFDRLPPSERQEIESARVRAGQAFRDRKGLPRLDNRELSVGWDDLDRIDPGPLVASDCPPLARYLEAKIVGQRYLLAGDTEQPFVEAVPTFFLVVPMALWTSRALAAERGAGAVTEEDVAQALRLLDRTLGTIATTTLPKKVRKACLFLLTETDLVVSAVNQLLGRTEVSENEPPILT